MSRTDPSTPPGLRMAGILLIASVGLASCRTTGLGERLKPPEFRPAGQTRCQVAKSQNNPLVVEWPSTDRGALEAALQRAPVIVRYMGCEMQVLKSCRAAGQYRYVPITPKQDVVTIRDADELYAFLPVGAPLLESRLESSGQLDVDMMLVGRFEAEGVSRASALEGDCDGATHVVSGVTVGAFTFSAGARLDASAGVAGLAGGSTSAERHTLTRDGDPTACQRGVARGDGPPEGCGAIVRLEVTPLDGADVVARHAQVEPAPNADEGAPDGAYLLGGLGAVGVGVGTGCGLQALSLSRRGDQYCDGAACRDQRGIDLRERADTYATVSTVSFGVGLAALAAGAWVGLRGRQEPGTEQPDRARSKPQVLVGAGTVGVEGTW